MPISLNVNGTDMLLLNEQYYSLRDGTCIGIVLVKVYEDIKAYINKCTGLNIDIDRQRIISMGVPFYGFSVQDTIKNCKEYEDAIQRSTTVSR